MITIDDSESGSDYHSAEEERAPTSPLEISPAPEADGDWQRALKEAIATSETDVPVWNEILDILKTIVEDNTSANEEIDRMAERTVDILRMVEGGNGTKNPRGQKTGGRMAENGRRISDRTRRAKYLYQRYQEAFSKCPGKLANLAMEGKLLGSDEERVVYPEASKINDLYTSLWEIAGPQSVEVLGTQGVTEVTPTNEVWTPIEVEEIVGHMARMKAGTSAGVDGLKKAHLKTKGAVPMLAVLFNLLLLKGYFPKHFKENRTTLIPKPGKDVSDPRNWRPITIGSLLGRLFSNMIDIRLRRFIKQTERQKGFVNENGCVHNVPSY